MENLTKVNGGACNPSSSADAVDVKSYHLNKLIVKINEMIQAYGDAQYRYYTTTSSSFRTGIRNDKFMTDKTLTDIGFDGVENTDWENIVEEV